MLFALVLVGGLVGVATKSADAAQFQWIRDMANSPAVFVFALSLLAWWSPGPTAAALRSAVFFTVMCLAYYTWSSEIVGFGGGRFLLVWIAVSLTFVPAAAAALRWAFVRAGMLPAAIVATAAGTTAAGFGEVRQLLRHALGDLPDGVPLHPVQAVIGGLLALIIAGLLPLNRRTRWRALLLLAPAAWVVGGVIDRLYSTGLLT